MVINEAVCENGWHSGCRFKLASGFETCSSEILQALAGMSTAEREQRIRKVRRLLASDTGPLFRLFRGSLTIVTQSSSVLTLSWHFHARQARLEGTASAGSA